MVENRRETSGAEGVGHMWKQKKIPITSLQRLELYLKISMTVSVFWNSLRKFIPKKVPKQTSTCSYTELSVRAKENKLQILILKIIINVIITLASHSFQSLNEKTHSSHIS